MALAKADSASATQTRILDVFSASDPNGSGEIDRELLVRLLLLLSPSLKIENVEGLLADLGLPKAGRVSYQSFVSSLFDCNSGEDRNCCIQSKGERPKQHEQLQPYGEVFVHGSGDCDQLGLGDAHRERKKPTLVRGLAGLRIVSIACGGLHTICTTSGGRLYSWGCGDDGALGRPSSDTDCEPGLVQLPDGVGVQNVACGDSHSAMVDSTGRVWNWGSFKDTSGFIGIATRDAKVVERSFQPSMVAGLESVLTVSCGCNHTVALLSGGQAFAWGSNQSSQLGLPSGRGCEFVEDELSGVDATSMPLLNREGSGVVAIRQDLPSPVHRVVAVRTNEGLQLDASEMLAPEVQEHIVRGGSLLTCSSREVSLQEKQSLLFPQEISLGSGSSSISNVFATSESTFLTTADGRTYGCGLNCDGQVGIGIVSTVVLSLRPVEGLNNADWIGGGLHMSAALVAGQVFTWGRAEECGLGLHVGSPPVCVPRRVEALPPIRTLRCGMSHTLACSENGHVYSWGCGIMHQLGNRPQNFNDPCDANKEPDDELVPYLISAKKFVGRRVLMADGGAQHSVELVWNDDGGTGLGATAAESDDDEQIVNGYEMESGTVVEPDIDQDDKCEVLVVNTSDEFWRVQLEAIYKRRNPHKLENVPKLLQKYQGREATLYAKVCKTYDLDPLKFYADPEAWAAEDTDVKPDYCEHVPLASEEVGAEEDPRPLFGGLLASCAAPDFGGLFNTTAPAGLFNSTAPAGEDWQATSSSTPSLFQFQGAEANSSSDDDRPHRVDRKDAKSKRPRVAKNSAFLKKSPKEKRKPH